METGFVEGALPAFGWDSPFYEAWMNFISSILGLICFHWYSLIVFYRPSYLFLRNSNSFDFADQNSVYFDF